MSKRVFHRRNDEHTGSAGFTVVELVVVIAMTAVLTALLLPALSSAKEKARRAVCKSDLRQLYFVVQMYANDHDDFLPSAADNKGNYHSIRLSDETFTTLVDKYASGCSNIFYCPNLGTSKTFAHDTFGYTIGYSYLADDVQTTVKGADYADTPIKVGSVSATNELLADANYWTSGASAYGAMVKMAPHTAMGAATALSSISSGATNSAGLGAMGGNIELYDGSVSWCKISSMQTHPASSMNDASGNW